MKIIISFSFFFLVCTTSSVFAKNSTSVDVSKSLEQAFAYSPNLQKTQEARQQAEHDVRRAEAGYFPTIGIWGGVGGMQENTASTRFDGTNEDTFGSVNLGLMVSQPLWQGGAVSSSVRSSKSSLDSSIFMVLDGATALAYNTISTHADVLRRQKLLKLSQKNVNEHKKILELLNIRFSSGLSSQGDVEQVSSRLNRAEATHLAYQEGYDAARVNYRRLTGQSAPKNLAPVALPARIFDSAKSVRDLCVRYNYRLQASLAQIDALVGKRDATRAGFLPKLSIDAGPGYSNTDRGDDVYEVTWSAMLNMEWSLYSGGADLANFHSNSARVRGARKSLHETMDTLDAEISLAYNRTITASKQTIYFDNASKASRIARDNFFTQFEVGQKDLLSVLDAETEAFTAAVEAIVTQVDSVIGQYRMYALAGTLLETVGINRLSVSEGVPIRAAVDEVNILPLNSSPREDIVLYNKESNLRRE